MPSQNVAREIKAVVRTSQQSSLCVRVCVFQVLRISVTEGREVLHFDCVLERVPWSLSFHSSELRPVFLLFPASKQDRKISRLDFESEKEYLKSLALRLH